MQNLTAKYNIIYNARILLEDSKRKLEAAAPEDYSQLLTVYYEPTELSASAAATDLDSVILKAKTIIDEKINSNYVDNAYFLIGEANYYKARFFNAAEFFTYVHKTYPDEQPLRLQALIYEARSLMQLDKTEDARMSLDTALKHINDSKKTKKIASEVYAVNAQYFINTGEEAAAIDMLKKAIDSKGSGKYRLRWTYLLAQLQDRNKQYEEAYRNYTSIIKSNAPFNMAFNAGLNRIAIEDIQSGRSIDKIARLKSLLKNEKNKNFTDQIYYRIGDVYLSRNATDEAIRSYNLAIANSSSNQNQKGLSYLKIADIYFRQGDYVRSKAYYDSTLRSLNPSYPGYDLIKRKSNNLELLASRFRVIAREDTLQQLAALPASEREIRVGELVRAQSEKVERLSRNNQAPGPAIAAIDPPSIRGTAVEGKFYFNNVTAVSQGLTDFKRRWGNRPLEDNWRRSEKTAAEQLTSQAASPGVQSLSGSGQNPALADPEELKKYYTANIPLTEPALQLSRQRMADAYYDIASFYRDELRDNTEAIKTFEELLAKAPESTYKLSVYYNLYRLYSGVDEQKSQYYRDLLLSKYPESPFARVIKDPDYARKTNEKEARLNALYNQVYDHYIEKSYSQVIQEVDAIHQQYGENFLSPQLAYLKALATGHLQKLLPFEAELQKITQTYPDDKLITPLVKQHLQYISNNRAFFEARETALTEFSASEPTFVEPVKQASQSVRAQNTVAESGRAVESKSPTSDVPAPSAQKQDEPVASIPEQTEKEQGITAKEPEQAVQTPEAIETQPTKPKPAYDLPKTGEYYFVINVQDAGANLNSSRFGVGQFNRTRFSGAAIKHQLKELNNENQLVFVGPFENYDSAKYYERSILPLLKDIMKVPAEKYNTFVITKQELDKLETSKQIESYLDFYKNN